MQKFLQGKYKWIYEEADGVELVEPSAGTTFPSTTSLFNDTMLRSRSCLLYTSDAADE